MSVYCIWIHRQGFPLYPLPGKEEGLLQVLPVPQYNKTTWDMLKASLVEIRSLICVYPSTIYHNEVNLKLYHHLESGRYSGDKCNFNFWLVVSLYPMWFITDDNSVKPDIRVKPDGPYPYFMRYAASISARWPALYLVLFVCLLIMIRSSTAV